MLEISNTRSLPCLDFFAGPPALCEAIFVYCGDCRGVQFLSDDYTVGRWDKLTPKFPTHPDIILSLAAW